MTGHYFDFSTDDRYIANSLSDAANPTTTTTTACLASQLGLFEPRRRKETIVPRFLNLTIDNSHIFSDAF
jgi:hypothetical protein